MTRERRLRRRCSCLSANPGNNPASVRTQSVPRTSRCAGHPEGTPAHRPPLHVCPGQQQWSLETISIPAEHEMGGGLGGGAKSGGAEGAAGVGGETAGTTATTNGTQVSAETVVPSGHCGTPMHDWRTDDHACSGQQQ